MAWARKSARGNKWLLLIGIFKLLKGFALLFLAIGMLHLMHRDIESSVTRWVEALRFDPDNRYIHGALTKIFNVTPRQLRELSAGTLLYAGLFLTEGVGLLRKKHWAEYLALISTALFIPLELYEIWRRFTPLRLSLLLVNVLIVWYLARLQKRGR